MHRPFPKYKLKFNSYEGAQGYWEVLQRRGLISYRMIDRYSKQVHGLKAYNLARREYRQLTRRP